MTKQPERRDLSEVALTDAVLESFATSGDDRFRTVMESLVRHLHLFAREVNLREDEWFAAIDFLTRSGQISDERRQEFVLLSDVLGLSMLVIGLNHPSDDGATESTVLGPFFVEGSPGFQNGDDIAAGAPGQPCFISGTVRSVDGTPVPRALIEIWQADEDGFYDVQRKEVETARGRGHLRCAEDGRFWFWSVVPEPYPIPDDGPVGELLTAAGRGPWRPAHVHFMIREPGFHSLITHVFAAGDRYLDSDAVFGVKSSLIGSFERHEDGQAPDGRAMRGTWFSLEFDLALSPAPASGK